jgi:protein-tyrosine phosphatase
MESPLRDAYWVVDGLLLAGRYAGDYDDEVTRERIGALLEAGIRVVIDLTEPGELPAYHDVLREEASARGVQIDYVRTPIPDRAVPSSGDLADILRTIDVALAQERPVYVHCQGGIGRTGTIVGCWLAQNGYPGEAALERLAELRSACATGCWPSPETNSQRRMVQRWTNEGKQHGHRL